MSILGKKKREAQIKTDGMRMSPKEQVKRDAAQLLRGHGWDHKKIGQAVNKPASWIKVAIGR